MKVYFKGALREPFGMRILLMLLLLSSCGAGKTIIVDGVLPEDKASALESSQLDEALSKIQSDFDEIGVEINVRSIPYTVNDLGENAGICVRRADGRPKGISIDHKTFWGFDFDRNHELPQIYNTLLHEIGHCFFNRSHEDDWLQVPQKCFLAKYYPDRSPTKDMSLQLSVMNIIGWNVIPTSIWPYFVKEIAGVHRLRSWQEMQAYVNIELVDDETGNCR